MANGADEPMRTNRENETGAIKDEIERTRGQMSRTVNQIEERLSPAHLKEQARDLKESVIGEYHEAKDHLKDDLSRELHGAKEKLTEEVHEAKAKVQGEIQHVRTVVRDATVGRVEHMVHDARETVTEAGTSVLDTIKANPIPAALVAVGLGWLIVSARSSSNIRQQRARGYRREFGDGYGGGYGYGYAGGRGDGRYSYAEGRTGQPRRMLREGQRFVDDAVHAAEEGVANVGHRVQEGATQFADQASGVMHDVGERAAHLAHDAAAGIEHVATDARDAAVHFAEDAGRSGRRIVRRAGRQARRVEHTFESTLRSNPLAAGAVAVAVGAAIGLALPHTEAEDGWMGGTKDRLMERAEDLAEGALHKVDETVGQLGAGDSSADDTAETKTQGETGHNGLSNGISTSSTSKSKSPTV